MELNFRFATIRDLDLYFEWANDAVVRENSYTNEPIDYEKHVNWFKSKLIDKNCYFYFFTSESKAVGQVRIQSGDGETVIGISIDSNFRGRSLAGLMLKKACDHYLSENPEKIVTAYIKKENTVSYHSFIKAGFEFSKMLDMHGFESYQLHRKKL